jgi:Sterol carrier protein domain
VRELGAAYLGGTRIGSLAAAGLVTEHRPGTLARLSAAMSWDPSPWCPGTF